MIAWVNVERKGMRSSGNVVCFECRAPRIEESGQQR